MKTVDYEAVTAILALHAKRSPPKINEGEGNAKRTPENTYGLPTGRAIWRELTRWFRKQLRRILGTISTIGTEIPAVFPSLTDYNDPMARAMTPILSGYWDESGKQARERLGLDPDDWKVTNPHLRAQIQKQAMAFCAATNATTSLALTDALQRLREELHAGTVEHGESLDQLTKRVNGVFQDAETWRARRIAATESARAVHAAQETAAIESGVVAGFEWLISGDACPLCRMVAAEAKRVRIGQAFAVVGDDPIYSHVKFPPLHPHCQCALIEILTPEYGGPENPDWNSTLIQPKPGPDYKPPKGVAEPKPDPKKLTRPRKTKPKVVAEKPLEWSPSPDSAAQVLVAATGEAIP